VNPLNDHQCKAVFIDKDGTLIPDIPYNVNPDLVQLDIQTIEGLRLLKDEGFLLVIISNQPGIAKGFFTKDELQKVWDRISGILQKHHLSMDAFYYCPHYPDAKIAAYAKACDCRKPLPGLILNAAQELNIDLTQSWMIGDILNDVEAGNRAGCATILIDNGNETEWKIDSFRKATFTAKNFLEAAAYIKMHVTKPVLYEQ
jgi:D-glycero-D-manno-heptose 1,7-bisphosphate phosphatase